MTNPTNTQPDQVVPAPTDRIPVPMGAVRGCCTPVAGRGWSPPTSPADTRLKQAVDRVLPRAGWPVVAYFAVVIAVMNLAGQLEAPAALVVTGLGALGGGSWCALNFWRCGHAHCLVTGTGWLALAVFAFAEAVLGHSVIAGGEGLAFTAVLVAGLAFEAVWYLLRGTNVVTRHRVDRRTEV